MFTEKPRDRISHDQGHVTVTCKVTRKCHSVNLFSYDFSNHESVGNNKKIINSFALGPWIGQVTSRSRYQDVHGHA